MNFSKNPPPKVSGNVLPRTSKDRIISQEDGLNMKIVVDEKTHIHRKFSIDKINSSLQKEFYKKKGKLQGITWQEARNSDKNGLGYRSLTHNEVKPPLPDSIVNGLSKIPTNKWIKCFKYYNKSHVMAGAKIQNKFYVFWIAKDDCDIYDH